MSEMHATYIIDMELPDILVQLNAMADDLRGGEPINTDDEIADLLGDAAEEIESLRAELAAIRQNPSTAFPPGRHDVEAFYTDQTDIGLSYAEVDAALRNNDTMRGSQVDEQLWRKAHYATGVITRHPEFDVYLRMQNDNEEPVTLMFPVSVAVRVAAMLNNAAWSAMLYGREALRNSDTAGMKEAG